MKYTYNKYEISKPFTEIFSNDINLTIDIDETIEDSFTLAFFAEVNQTGAVYQLTYSYADVFLMLNEENYNWSHQGYAKEHYAEDFLRIIRKDVIKNIFNGILPKAKIQTHRGVSTPMESLSHIGDFRESGTTRLKVVHVNFWKDASTYIFIKATGNDCRNFVNEISEDYEIKEYGICSEAVCIKISGIIEEESIEKIFWKIHSSLA